MPLAAVTGPLGSTPSPRGTITSVGSRSDSYSNGMAESLLGVYKTELITAQGPWQTVEDVEPAILNWVHCWNNSQFLEPVL